MSEPVIQTTVGGPGWQRTYTAPIIRPKPQRRQPPDAFYRNLEAEYGIEAARMIGLGKWPTEAQLEAELSQKLGAKVDIQLAPGEIVLSYEYSPSRLKSGGVTAPESFTVTKVRALDFMDYLAGKVVAEKLPANATFEIVKTETPWGYTPVTSTEKIRMEAFEERARWTAFSEWVQQAKQWKPQVIDPQTMAYLGIGEAQAAWRQAQKQIPEGAEFSGLRKTQEGYEATYKTSIPEYSLGEVWLQGSTLEDVLSGLIFRNIWDPAYKQQLAMKQQEFKATHDMEVIQRQQTQQGELAISLAIIGYTAFDVGRSLYHIAKWGGARGKPIISLESPELEEKPFTYAQFTGPKGARTTELKTYIPREPLPEKFSVSWTRGHTTTPMKVTLEKALKATKASTTLPHLLFWPSQFQEIRVPFGLYHPRFLTEFTSMGISLGSLFGHTQTELRHTMRLAKEQRKVEHRLKQPERLFEKREVRGIIRNKQVPSLSISQALGALTETETMQAQALKQSLALVQPQLQLQRQKQLQKQNQLHYPRLPQLRFDEYFPKQKRKQPSKWWLRKHPLPKAKTLVQRYVTGGGKKHRAQVY